jgi:hypothetical protein
LNRTELKDQLKTLLVEGLKLENVTPAEIKDDEPISSRGSVWTRSTRWNW